MDTPLRWGGRGTQETIAASSEGPSSHAVLSSPNRNLHTSPLAPGMSEVDLSSPLNYGTPGSLGSVTTPRSGIRGTPVRQRSDIRTERRMRQVNIGDTVINSLYFVAYSNISIIQPSMNPCSCATSKFTEEKQ